MASESPVTVSTESDRLGLSSWASGAKLSCAICRALWQSGPWMAGVSVGRSKVSTVWVLEPSSSSLSRLLYGRALGSRRLHDTLKMAAEGVLRGAARSRDEDGGFQRRVVVVKKRFQWPDKGKRIQFDDSLPKTRPKYTALYFLTGS